MDSLDAAIFVRLVDTFSFKSTAEHFGLSKSTISKRIARLEEELDVVLLNRSPRSVALTEAGRKFYEHCAEIERALEEARASVRQADGTPRGTLRFSLPSSLGAALMPMLMKDFLREYPQVQPIVHFAEPFVDVIAGGYDVVIRFAQKLPDSTLVAQKLGTTPKVLVASPGYLEAHGSPSHPRDLKRHACMGITYGSEAPFAWRFNGPEGALDVPVRYSFCANNDLTLNLAACMDGGFLYTARALVASEIARNRLQVVLPEYRRVLDYGIYAVYPQKSPPAKVGAFVDFVRDRLEALEDVDRWEPLSYP